MSVNDIGGGENRPLSIVQRAIGWLDALTKLAFYLSAAILGVIVTLYCMEIVLRYFFLSPTTWTRDTVTYLLCATIFLAAPEVARNNNHVAITILVERCGDTWRRRIETALALITAAVAGGVCWVTAGQTFKLFSTGILTLGTVAVPKWWISVFIPIGLLLISLQYLSLALDERRRGHDRTHV